MIPRYAIDLSRLHLEPHPAYTRWALVFAALVSSSCQLGTDTGNPPAAIDSFDTTACKAQSSELWSSTVRKADTRGVLALDEERYRGLTCFRREDMSDQGLHLEIVNLEGACGVSDFWEPRASVGADGLRIELDNPTCTSAACDHLLPCTYDLAFDLRMDERPSTLSLSLFGDSCGGPAELIDRVRLGEPHAGPSEWCRYAYDVELGPQGFSGPRFTRCDHASTDDASVEPCTTGLTCAEVAAGESRCLPPCQTHVDCQGFAQTHCEEGGCRL